jgi:hypothetical protein
MKEEIMDNLPLGRVEIIDQWKPTWGVDRNVQRLEINRLWNAVDSRIQQIDAIADAHPVNALGELLRAAAFVGAAVASNPGFIPSLKAAIPSFKQVAGKIGKSLGATSIEIGLSATGISIGFSFPLSP